MSTALKDPAKVRAGKLGMRARWGQHMPRVLRLETLNPDEQAVVRALIRLRKAREAQEMTGSAGRSAEPVEMSEVQHGPATPTS